MPIKNIDKLDMLSGPKKAKKVKQETTEYEDGHSRLDTTRVRTKLKSYEFDISETENLPARTQKVSGILTLNCDAPALVLEPGDFAVLNIESGPRKVFINEIETINSYLSNIGESFKLAKTINDIAQVTKLGMSILRERRELLNAVISHGLTSIDEDEEDAHSVTTDVEGEVASYTPVP